MTLALITLPVLLAAAYFTTKPLGRCGRAAVYGLYLLLYAFIFPLLVWLPLYFSADFSREINYPEGLQDYLYSSRDSERQWLPVNADGLIALEEYKPGASRKRRVVLLGDSFAAGFGLSFGETLGARLQEQLGSGYQVINGAFFGTNAEMQVELFFRKLAKYEPKVIVIRCRMDDVMPLAEKYYRGAAGDIMVRYAPLWPRGVKNLFMRRETLLVREKFWKHYRAETEGVIKRNLLSPYGRLGEYAAKKGVRVVLVLDSCPQGYEAVCAASAAEAARLKWELLDPSAEADLSSPEMTIPGDGHPSARANLFLARYIGGRLTGKRSAGPGLNKLR